MKQQIAAAAFLVLTLLALFSMKEQAGPAASHLVVAGGGCPVPYASSLTN